MTVRELLDRIDARELAEWAAFFRIEKAQLEEERNPKSPKKISEKIKAAFKRK